MQAKKEYRKLNAVNDNLPSTDTLLPPSLDELYKLSVKNQSSSRAHYRISLKSVIQKYEVRVPCTKIWIYI